MEETFPELLKALMATRDVSQSDVARALDVAASRVSIWKSGKGRPEPRNLERMAEVFALDFDRLLRVCGYRSSERADSLDPEEAEVLALLRLVPEEHIPAAKQMLRGLAVPPLRPAPIRKRQGEDNREPAGNSDHDRDHSHGDGGANQGLSPRYAGAFAHPRTPARLLAHA